MESTRPLPFLRSEPEPPCRPDVHVEFAPWPGSTEPVTHVEGVVALHGPGCAVFTVAPGSRVVCLDGRRIVVDLAASLDDAELHTLLFGRPFGWLLHQRGLCPLHAAVVRIGDAAVALAGHSGQGKSTLARAFVARGHGLTSDDMAVVDPRTLLVAPGFPSLKLWRDVADAHGDDRRVAVRADVDKYHVGLPEAFETAPAPLRLVVAIGRDPARPDIRLLPLERRQSAAMLRCHLVNADLARRSGAATAGFHWTLAVAAQVPVVALDRRDDMAAIPAICAAVERLLERPGAAA